MTSIIKEIVILHKLKFNKKPNKEEVVEKFKNIVLNNNLDKEKYLHSIYDNINYQITDNETFDFLSIVRNGEFYYSQIFPRIYKNICKNMKVRFFIYENNSTDNTKQILNNLELKNHNIFVKCENLFDLPKNRIKKIILARNNLKEFYLDCNFEYPSNNKYVILYDTDIIFNFEITINKILNVARRNLNFSMLLSYGIFSGYTKCLTDILLKHKKFSHEETKYINLMLTYYYDTLALDYGKYFKKNTIDFFNKSNLIKVNTGFGGVGLVKKGFYITSKYDDFKKPIDFNNKYFKDNMLCEHWGFSERMRKNGDIFIVKEAECLWYQDKDINEKDFYFYVKFFINNKGFNNIYR
jgi:hypothetical protein